MERSPETPNDNVGEGDVTLLEEMMRTFIVSHANTDFEQVPLESVDEALALEGDQATCADDRQVASNTHFDLDKILATYTLENSSEDLTRIPSDNETLNEVSPLKGDTPLEVLFRREEPRKGTKVCESPSCEMVSANNEDKAILSTESRTSQSTRERLPFSLSKNEDYRVLMEETMFIKCCSKQILEMLEETQNLLCGQAKIRNDPGFGKISTFQAWIWICNESILISSSATKVEKKRKKNFNTFISRVFANFNRFLARVQSDMKSLLKSYDKIQSEFYSMREKSLHKFSQNLEGAHNYEMTSSGFNFFLHHETTSKEKQSTTEICCDEGNPRSDSENTSNDPNPSLNVRLSIDGVTIRSTLPGSSWIKFQNVEDDTDKEILLKMFINEMCAPFIFAQRKNAIIHKLLEGHSNYKHKRGKLMYTQTILHSISKCKSILEKSRGRTRSYLPKEEVVALYSLKSAKAAFDLIKSLLTDVIIQLGNVDKLMESFSSQKKRFESGNANHAPIERHFRLEMEIGNVNRDADAIINRYSNSDEVSQFVNETGSEEFPLETCPPNAFLTPSTLVLEAGESTSKEKESEDDWINPACYLFSDLEAEYKENIRTLITTRTVTPDVVVLCSDPIRKFHKAAEAFFQHKDRMLTNIAFAVQNLTHTLDVDNRGKTENGVWIQMICKSLQVWDFHALQGQLKVHFHAVNERTLQWMTKLEKTFGAFTRSVMNLKQDFFDYYDLLEMTSGFSTWMKQKFSFDPMEDMRMKLKQDEESSEISEDSSITSKETSRLLLNFQEFDMDLVFVGQEGEENTLLTLNKASNTVQVGLITLLFTQVDRVMSRAVVNLNSAIAISQRYISIKPMRSALTVDTKVMLQHLHPLENLVIALTMENVHKAIKECIAYVGMLDNCIAQFSQMLQLVQLQMDEREITGERKVRVRTSSVKTKKKVQFQTDRNHPNASYLSEVWQFVNSSVKVMPNTFEMLDESLKTSYQRWVQLAEKDARLVAAVRSQVDIDSLDASDDEELREFNEASECPIIIYT